MARLIDANALYQKLLKLASLYDVDYLFFDVVSDEIDNAPTIDAVEVVHGHWVSLTECANAGVYCSVCNKNVYKEDYARCNRKNRLRSNYCPNCGADMRERKDNE